MEEDDPNKCLICNEKIGKFHLKIAACRACTVFFRRSIQTGRQYKCQLGYKSCNLKSKTPGKPLCRYCRLEKCKELGMKLERVRQKSKVHASKSEASSPAFPQNIRPASIESVIKSPIQDSPCSSASRISDKKQFINVQPLEQQIKDILSQSPTSLTLAPGIRLTFLQQLCFHFPLFYEEVKSKHPVIVTTVFNRFRHFQFIQRWWLELAKLLMKCEQFAQLNFEDKWLLYKHAWKVFFKHERYFSSIQVFGTSYNDNRILYDDTTALDYSHPDLTVAEFETVEKREQWKNLMMPILEKYIKSIVNPMKALQISQFELIYMLAQVLWTSQFINGLSENATRIAEEISDQISNELHNYYVQEKHLTNYASRLTKLNKIIAATEVLLHAKKDVSIIAKIFNFYDLEVIGSELCD